MSTRNRKLLALGTGLAATFSLISFTSPDPAQTRALAGASIDRRAPEGAELAPLDVAEGPVSGLAHRLPVGQTLRYAARSASATSQALKADASRQSQVAGTTRTGDMTVSGELTARVLGSEAGWHWVEYALERPVLTLQTQGRRQEVRQGLEPLSLPVLVRVARDGRLLGAHFSARQPADARNLLRGLVATLHPTLPAKPVRRWRCDEQDPCGRYRAAYRLVGRRGAELEIERRKLRYHAHGSVMRDLGKARVSSRDALLRFRFDSLRGLVTRAEFSETFEVRDAPLLDRATTTYSGRLLLLSQRVDPELAARASRRLAALRGAHGAADPYRLEATARGGSKGSGWTISKDLRGLDTEALLALLEGERAATDGLRYHNIWRAIVARLRASPEALAVAFERIGDRRLGLRARSALLTALGAAGTAAAQETLARAMAEQSLEEELMHSALIGVTQIKQPTRALARALEGLSSAQPSTETSRMALLSLGTVASYMAAGGDPRTARALIGRLNQEYERADNGRDAANLLAALANTRTPESLSLIKAVASGQRRRFSAPAQQMALRSMAVAALGDFTVDPSAPSHEAAALVSKILRADRSWRVRLSALREVARRDQAQDGSLLIAVAQEDADQRVRRTALSALAQGRKTYGEQRVRRALARVAARDASPRLRRHAAALLRRF